MLAADKPAARAAAPQLAAAAIIVRHRLEMVAGERPAVLRDGDLAGVVKP